MTAIKVEGAAGSLINQGTFATKGETTFHTLENTGTAYFEKLAIDGQGTNEGELRVHSLEGKGHFYNHGKLIFLHQPTKVAQIKIAHLTNETKGDSTNDAVIHGTDVVISAAMKSLTLNQGKVQIRNLTFSGGKIAYENKGEITAEILTLTQLQQSFVNSHLMTIDILAVNTSAGFTNHGDLQLGSLTMDVDLLDAAPVIPNFINRGDFSIAGQSTFYDLENQGTADLGHVIINGQGNNKGALMLDSLKGNGQFHNSNVLTFKSATDKDTEIWISSFTNASEVKGDSVIVTDAVKAFVLEKGKVDIKSLTLNGKNTIYENHGEMIVEALILNLLLGDHFINKGDIHVSTINGAWAALVNEGVLRAKDATLNYFMNHGQALVEIFTLHGIGQNNGFLNLITLNGQGNFHNHAQLAFKGSTDIASLLGINSFVSGGNSKSKAEINATALIVMPDVKTFDLKSGSAEINSLIINAGAGTAQCSNAGDLITSQLQMNQSSFYNSGYLSADSFGGKLTTLVNTGDFTVKTQTALSTAQFTNSGEGTANFEGKAQFKDVAANGQLSAKQGLEVITWAGQGVSEIYQFFKAAAVDNQGILHLIDAKTTLPQILTNKGDLRLRQITFTNTQQRIVNFKTLVLENGLTLASLTNHDHVYVGGGKYKMENLVNKSKIILFGDQWVVSTTDHKTADFIASTIQNAGEISTKGRLVALTPAILQGLWTAGGDVIYKFSGAILTPESFVGITFGGKLVVEAGSFVVAKPATLSIPHLVLHLSDTFHIESTLTTNTLEVYVKKSFTCGKSLIVNGDLTVQAPSLPTQHADIHASGMLLCKQLPVQLLWAISN